MKTVFATLFCLVLCPVHASAQSPIAAARGRTIDVSLGYSYVSRDSHSNRLGLTGVDAGFPLGASRLAIKADLGYARASNVFGTGRHSDVLSYLAGPVFHPTRHRYVDTYIHTLVGGASFGSDYLRTSYFDASLATRGQSNLRATSSVVYFFGRRSRTWR